MKRPKIRAGRALFFSFLLLAGCVWIAADSLFELSRQGERTAMTVTVPDLRGQVFTDGEMLDADRFTVEVTYVYDPDIPPRTVISQDPLPGVGRKIIPGERLCHVALTVSLGEHTVRLPDLEGLDVREAALRLGMLGFSAVRTVGGADEQSALYSTEPYGTVSATQPSAGQAIPLDSPVTLYVRPLRAAASVACPDLTGLTQFEAEAVLRKLGLSSRITVREYADIWGIRTDADGMTDGTVLSQDRPAGAYLPPGSTVTLTVARITVTIPNTGRNRIPFFGGWRARDMER